MRKHIIKKRGPVKRLTAFAAALSLVCLLAACRNGGNGNGGNDGNNSTTQAGTAAEETAAESGTTAKTEMSESSPDSAGTDQGNENSGTSSAFGSSQETGENSHVLIAYFSVPEDVDTDGVDAIAGASIVVKDGEVTGNTEYVAGLIQETVGGDLFRIETVQAYPLDHDPLVDQAAEEQDEDARPALSTHIENPEQYDTIILGYPNWWGDLPQPLYTFLEEYDFSGKTIIPFVTHGGSGFSGTRETISRLQPGAVVSDNTLSLSRGDVAGSRDEVIAWAEGLGL